MPTKAVRRVDCSETTLTRAAEGHSGYLRSVASHLEEMSREDPYYERHLAALRAGTPRLIRKTLRGGRRDAKQDARIIERCLDLIDPSQ